MKPSTLPSGGGEREFFIDNLLVRIHFIIEMIWWTGLVPWEFEFPSPGSLTSTFLRLKMLNPDAGGGHEDVGREARGRLHRLRQGRRRRLMCVRGDHVGVWRGWVCQ